MPTTELELCATALLKIGARPIASLDEPGPEAECARRLYPVARDGLLSVHPWTFTLALASLTGDPAPPPDYARSFTLPTDLLRVISAGVGRSGRGLTYAIRGTKLLADAEAVTLSYQRRPAVADFPPFFIQPLLTRLAADFCIPLTESTSRATDLFRLAEAELRVARLVDSQQATPRRLEDFSLVEARLS